jgi:hypothetical protein
MFVAVLGMAGCADEVDEPIGRPVTPGVAPSQEPMPVELDDYDVPLRRPETAQVEGITTPDTVSSIGRDARAYYDRLRAAGLVR